VKDPGNLTLPFLQERRHLHVPFFRRQERRGAAVIGAGIAIRTMVEKGTHQRQVAVLGGRMQGDEPPGLPSVRIGAGGEEEGTDPGVMPGGGGVERSHLHSVPGGAVHRGAAVEEHLDCRGATEEGGEVERTEAIGRPGPDLIAGVEKFAEEVGLSQRGGLEKVERRVAVQEGREDVLLAAIERREDGGETLMVPRGGKVAVPVEEGIDPGTLTGPDGGEEFLGLRHPSKVQDSCAPATVRDVISGAPGWPPGAPTFSR
jgi:hypothetical protein